VDLGQYKTEKSAKKVKALADHTQDPVRYYLEIQGVKEKRLVSLQEVDHALSSRESKVERLKQEIASCKLLIKDISAL